MTPHRCLLCVGGLMPAGIDPYFGPVYRGCPQCHTRCRGCDGLAMFPAIRGYTLEAVFNVLYQLGWDVNLCDDCTGITNLWPPQLAAAAAPQLPDVTVYLPNGQPQSTRDAPPWDEDHEASVHRAENLLRKLVDDYYDAARSYLRLPANPAIDRALLRARMTAIADIGTQLAAALNMVVPDWDLMRDLAKPDPWVEQ